MHKFEWLSARYKAGNTAEFSAVIFSSCGESSILRRQFSPTSGGIGSRSAQNGGHPYSHTSVRNQSNSAPVKIYVSVWISSKVRKLLRNAQF